MATTRDRRRRTGRGHARAGLRGRRTVRYGARVGQPSPRWLPPVRGGLLAALATLLTTVGHLVGGGSLEQLSPLAVLVPMLATVLVALAERCRGLVAVLAVLGAGQVALHYLLVLLTAHGHRRHDAGPVDGGRARRRDAGPRARRVFRRRRRHRPRRRAAPHPAPPRCGFPPSRSRCPRARSRPRTSRSSPPSASSPPTRGAGRRSPAESLSLSTPSPTSPRDGPRASEDTP